MLSHLREKANIESNSLIHHHSNSTLRRETGREENICSLIRLNNNSSRCMGREAGVGLAMKGLETHLKTKECLLSQMMFHKSVAAQATRS